MIIQTLAEPEITDKEVQRGKYRYEFKYIEII